MTRAVAPGKVMLAGEYAVLLPDQPCLVAAVNRTVTVEAQPASRWSIDTGAVRWSEGEPVVPGVQFVAEVLRAASEAFGVGPHRIETKDELHFDGLKLGLGGSAAITVASAIALAPAGTRWGRLWALADAVHRRVQGGRGSGADVAASLCGGVTWFVPAHDHVPASWSPVAVHPSIKPLLVWTGASVKTAPRLEIWERFVARKPESANTFARLSADAVNAVASGLRSGDAGALRGGMAANRAALKGLESELGLDLETPAIKAAADAAWRAGACGKLSGAGGGDCAIVLAVGDEVAAAASREIEAQGLRVIPFEWGAPPTRDGNPIPGRS